MGFAPPRHCRLGADSAAQVFAELEAGGGASFLGGAGLGAGHDLVGGQREPGRGAMVGPVDDRSSVVGRNVGDLLHLGEHARYALGQTFGNVHVAQRAANDGGTFGRPHDGAFLVDPHCHRDVAEAEQFVGDVLGIDQARVCQRRVLRPGGVDPLGGVRRLHIESDGDDGEPQRLQFGMECLPPGQAGAAASITRPGDQQHLSAVQRRQPKRQAVVSS